MLFPSCAKGPQKEEEVYHNDFESNDKSGITNGGITRYNNSNVLGRYNNGGFDLRLENLPDHDLIKIAFDLFIHDSWDGNENTFYGPDIWQMKVDNDMLINTTFSNCTGPCLPQSYPLNYLSNKYAPRSGATQTGLPGVCFNGITGNTTLYRIEKTVSHSSRQMTLKCLDSLKQKAGGDICDESWSVDNISIKLIKLK